MCWFAHGWRYMSYIVRDAGCGTQRAAALSWSHRRVRLGTDLCPWTHRRLGILRQDLNPSMGTSEGCVASLNPCPAQTFPVVDLQSSPEALAEQIRLAATAFGFFYVKNHGVSEELLEAMFHKSKQFFALPMDQKLLITANRWNRGYTLLSDELLDPANQTAPDTKEGLYFGREVDESEWGKPLHGPNQWPEDGLVPGYKETMQQYYAACLACMHQIVRGMAQSLGLPADFFSEHFDHPIASLRPLHYTPAMSDPSKGLFGAGAHTDYGMITILATDENEGLQVQVDGQWAPMPPKPGHLMINLGDLCHRWTNGQYRSALHRVVTTSGRDRYSTAFFVEPNFESVVEPLPQCCSSDNPARWPPVQTGEYLLSKYDETTTTKRHRQPDESQKQPAVPVLPEAVVAV